MNCWRRKRSTIKKHQRQFREERKKEKKEFQRVNERWSLPQFHIFISSISPWSMVVTTIKCPTFLKLIKLVSMLICASGPNELVRSCFVETFHRWSTSPQNEKWRRSNVNERQTKGVIHCLDAMRCRCHLLSSVMRVRAFAMFYRSNLSNYSIY